MIKKWIKTAKQIGLFRNRNYNFFLAAVLTYDDENGIIIRVIGRRDIWERICARLAIIPAPDSGGAAL